MKCIRWLQTKQASLLACGNNDKLDVKESGLSIGRSGFISFFGRLPLWYWARFQKEAVPYEVVSAPTVQLYCLQNLIWFVWLSGPQSDLVSGTQRWGGLALNLSSSLALRVFVQGFLYHSKELCRVTTGLKITYIIYSYIRTKLNASGLFINGKRRGQESINLGKFTESTSCFLVAS